MCSPSSTEIWRCVVCPPMSRTPLSSRGELEAHVASEHLDYFPYGCGHCGHWLATEEMVEFHALKKSHLPVKIKENLNMTKERRIREIIEQSADTHRSACAANQSKNSSSPSSGPIHEASSSTDSRSNRQSPVNQPPVTQSTKPTTAGVGGRKSQNGRSGSPLSVESANSGSSLALLCETTDGSSRKRPPPSLDVDNQLLYDLDANDDALPVTTLGIASARRSLGQDGPSRKRNKGLLSVVESLKQRIGDEDEDSPKNERSRDGAACSDVAPLPVQTETRNSRAGMGTFNDGPTPYGHQRCLTCQQDIVDCEVPEHVKKHVASRPLAGCAYCDYQGKSLNAVRVHITWKHAGMSTKTGTGVLDISHEGASYSSMYRICFDTRRSNHIDDGSKPTSSSFMSNRGAYKSVTAPNQQRTPQQKNPISKYASFKPSSLDAESTKNLPPESSLVSRTGTSSGGRIYRFLICQICGAECCDALASAHIYTAHIRRPDAVKCPYCQFGTSYALSEVKRHVAARHPNEVVRVVDSRAEMQDDYLMWRRRCFPDVGQRRQSGANTFVDGGGDDSSAVRYRTLRGTPLNASSSQRDTGATPTRQERSEFDRFDPSPPRRTTSSSNVASTSTQQLRASTTGTSASTDNNTATSCNLTQLTRDMKECDRCGMKVTALWLYRHVWKHLSDDYGIHCFECAAPGCQYTTYLKRSLETHWNSSHSDEWGNNGGRTNVVDKRPHYAQHYNRLMLECFGLTGDQALLTLNLPSGGEDEEEERRTGDDDEQGFTVQPQLEVPVTLWGEQQSAAGDNRSAFCHKCMTNIEREQVDEHVWQRHVGEDDLPYRCNRCGESYHSIDHIETHFRQQHADVMQQNGGEIDMTDVPQSRIRFENQMIECFPEIVSEQNVISPGIVKQEFNLSRDYDDDF